MYVVHACVLSFISHIQAYPMNLSSHFTHVYVITYYVDNQHVSHKSALHMSVSHIL